MVDIGWNVKNIYVEPLYLFVVHYFSIAPVKIFVLSKVPFKLTNHFLILDTNIGTIEGLETAVQIVVQDLSLFIHCHLYTLQYHD